MKIQLNFYSKLFITLLVSTFLSWTVWNLEVASPLLFIAITPLFIGLHEIIKSEKKNVFLVIFYIYLFKLGWVFTQMYWLKGVTFDTFYLAVLTHSLIFVIILTPILYLLKSSKKEFAFYYVILAWLLFEYLMQNLPLLSPFYLLGTAFGNVPLLIKSYSIIGIEGGSLWILLTNFFLFKLLINRKSYVKQLVVLVVVFITPLFLGFLFNSSHSSSKQIKVAALHTNFNPLNYNYALRPTEIIDSLWNLSKNVSKETSALVWPETVITNLGWAHELNFNPNVDSLQQKLVPYPNLSLIFGANLYAIGKDTTDKQLNYDATNNYYYYVYNMSFTLTSQKAIEYRSKEIFVPFQEQIPYVNQFPFLKKLITVVGNPNYYAENKNDFNVLRLQNGVSYSPLLCYEICYPHFTSKMSEDVGFIALSGNEHWNTSQIGSRIYFNILKSIAAQNACAIVKSSNNGISAIVDKNGSAIQEKKFNDTGLLEAKIDVKENSTFYSAISGYTSFIALLLTPILFVLARRKK